MEIHSQEYVIKINQGIEMLKTVALNVNSYGSTVEYIQVQIESEEKTKKSGYVNRVLQLKQTLDNAQVLSDMSKNTDLTAQLKVLDDKKKELAKFDMRSFV